MTFRLRHLIGALILHVALIGLLVGGVQCSSKPVRPPVIQAVLLNPDRMEEEMREESTRREVQREQSARESTERERKQAEWADVLERHVAKYWTRPASVATDFDCTVHVQLRPDGSVTFAKIDQSCGNAQLDKSVEDAVYRASPLPKPADPSVFDRDLV